MSFTAASVDFTETDALTAKILIFLMALFILVSAAGALLQMYVKWTWRNSSLGRSGASFLDLEDALGEESEPKQMIGLNKLFLESLPTFTFSKKMASETSECAVCLCEFQENEKGRLLPKCNHMFHVGCIDMWFHTHSTCPLCRASVGAEESLYFYPHIDEEMGFSSGFGTGAEPVTASLDQNMFLKAFTLDKDRIFEFLRHQGVRFWPWLQDQQPSSSFGGPSTNVNSSSLLHFNPLKRIFNMHRYSSDAGSSFRDFEGPIEAV